MCLIVKVLSILKPCLSTPVFNALCQICKGILSCNGKITMLEVSRYTDLSYRSIQRFFRRTGIPWERLNVLFFKSFIYSLDSVFLFVADEVVEKKAGRFTHGIARFFSNLEKQTVPGVSFLALSIVRVKTGKSFPLSFLQLIRPKKSKKPKNESASKSAKKAKAGRPKGSKNKPKQKPTDIQYQALQGLLACICGWCNTLIGHLPAAFLVLDGYFGNQHYMRLAAEHGLHLISKLRSDAALYLPYSGVYGGRGRRKKYGKKLDTKNISNDYLIKQWTGDNMQYTAWQVKAWSKSYTDNVLNVVVVRCYNLKNNTIGHCVLVSTDLNLGAEKLIEYYRLRFQIEFNFRDAKQFFGLADFKNYKEAQLNTAVSLAFFMCNVSYILREHIKERLGLKVLNCTDLKTLFRTNFIANKALAFKNATRKRINIFNLEHTIQIAENQFVNF